MGTESVVEINALGEHGEVLPSRGFQPLAELTAELFELEPEAVRMSKAF